AVIPDEEMKLDHELLRARRIAVSDDEIRIFHSSGEMSILKSEIILLVVGELRNIRVDYTEGISGRSGQSGTVLDSFEVRSGETLLDVYASRIEQGFRIKSDAFDYSGFIPDLSFRSEVNFRAAWTKLRADLPDVKVDDDFPKMRTLLSRRWPS